MLGFGVRTSAGTFLSLALIARLASSFVAATTRQGHFEKTFQVSGAVDLEVQTRSGDIIVRNGPAGSVSIRGKIYGGDHWLFGSRHTDVSGIEQHPPLRQGGDKLPMGYGDGRGISGDVENTRSEDTHGRRRSGP